MCISNKVLLITFLILSQPYAGHRGTKLQLL